MSEIKYSDETISIGNMNLTVSSSFDPKYPMVSNINFRSKLTTTKGKEIEIFVGDQCCMGIKELDETKPTNEILAYRNLVSFSGEPEITAELMRKQFKITKKESEQLYKVAKFCSVISQVWSDNYREVKND